MAILYDGKGKQIVIQEGGNSGNTELDYNGVSANWTANAETSYNAMMSEIKKLSYSGVPFFIQTDLHGRSNAPARWLHNKNKLVKNINLGDIVTDYYNDGENERYRNSALPVDNLITVFGNHEACMKGSAIPTSHGLNYHYTDTTKGKRIVNQYGFFTHYDDDYNVKYLIVSPYYMNEDGTRDGVEIRTDQMEWLLSELAADDGYDVVLLMHQLWTDTYISRNGTLQSWADAPVVLENMWSVLKDRKNNRSGTITDSSGVEHSYNFSNCKTELLVSLHGHSHEELYLQEENMLSYSADWYGNGNANRCTFGLIDRMNSKVIFWVFDNTGCWEPLELAI
jgi:predicted phosphodiesterase